MAVLAAELLKFVASFVLLYAEEGFSVSNTLLVTDEQIIKQPMDTLRLAVPAVIYFLQNIVIQLAASNLPAALFQVTYQGKTIVVAFCSVVLLRKQLKRYQWGAIMLMACGIAMVQQSSSRESKQSAMANGDEQYVPLGLLYVFLGCLCSGFAGVYFEMMVKKPTTEGSEKKPSMWIRNIQLSAFTMLLGGGALLATGRFSSLQDVLHGFNLKVWLMVVNTAIGGLCVAFVIKYADNILKGFACALATILATIVSVPLFGFEVRFSFFAGMAVVLYSTMLYGGTTKLKGEWWNQEPSLCQRVREAESVTVASADVLSDASQTEKGIAPAVSTQSPTNA